MVYTKKEKRRLTINSVFAGALGFITPLLNLGWFVQGAEKLTWNPIGMLVNIGLIIIWNALLSEQVFPDIEEKEERNTIDNRP